MKRLRETSTGSRSLRLLGAVTAGVLVASAASCAVDCRDYDGCSEYAAQAGAGGSSMTEGGSGGSVGLAGSLGDAGHGGAPNADGGSSGASGDAGASAGPCLGSDGESCPTEGDSIFVAEHGHDANPGTRDLPLQTLSEAVERAASAQKQVVACLGLFPENIELTDEVRVSLKGGFDCRDGWVATQERTLVHPPTGVPLRIDGVQTSVTVRGFEFQARRARAPGESSVAALIVQSRSVTLTNVALVAGEGADGEPALFEDEELQPAAPGMPADGLIGGESVHCSCESEQTVGGRGGDATDGATGAGEAGAPALGNGLSGKADTECSSGGGGARGSNGAVGAHGLGAKSLGALEPDGSWLPADGQPGGAGRVAQGGGGGGASHGKGGGGSGGCGGCGGKGGAGGRGGGGSFGLIVYESHVTLRSSEIQTDRGGRGGSGALGSPGQPGGAGASGGNYGCFGGNGGTGGPGGAGGGGAGGSSIGILSSGATIDRRLTPIRVGAAGTGGPAGSPENMDGQGREGVAELELQL